MKVEIQERLFLEFNSSLDLKKVDISKNDLNPQRTIWQTYIEILKNSKKEKQEIVAVSAIESNIQNISKEKIVFITYTAINDFLSIDDYLKKVILSFSSVDELDFFLKNYKNRH